MSYDFVATNHPTVDGPAPNGRAAEAWYFESTEAGRTVMAARAAI